MVISMKVSVEIVRNGAVTAVRAEAGGLLAEVLGEAGHPVDLPCGGKGRCGRCRVIATGKLSLPAEAERRLLTREELGRGVRFACLARVMGDTRVELPDAAVYDSIVTAGEMPPFAPAPIYARYGVAVDIGTTTIAAGLYGTDGFLGAASMKNPQSAFGADVISRIERSLAGETEALAAAVREAVARLAETLARGEGIGPEEIDAYVITGNTAMLYLLTGQNPGALSHAPFDADRLYGEDLPSEALGLPAGARVHLPRCMSAFVGADITTAVLASGMVGGTTALLCDIGTNGEIALWHGGQLHCCSTAAGPAFEGAGITMGTYGVRGAIDKVWVEDGEVKCSTIGGVKAVGICGSGIVDALAALLETGAVDETGALQTDGDVFDFGNGVIITAEDIRKVQLAKGSVRAGIETLLETVGVGKEQVDRLYIAGGFGSYLNLTSAAAIGLIPPELLPVTRVIGNAAQTGAAMLLQRGAFIREATDIAARSHTVELSGSPVFMEHYVEHMMFE